MLFKSNEIEDLKINLSEPEARLLLARSGFNDGARIDRYNIELLLRKLFRSDVSVWPNKSRIQDKCKIAWGFNYCVSSTIADRNVTENILEVPLLHEFLARGCHIDFIGKTSAKFEQFDDDMVDWSAEWKKLPRQYKPTPDWIEDCIENYESKYEMELPNVNFVIMLAFPSFPFHNMMFYLLMEHYSKKNIPVFLWDCELRTLYTKQTQGKARAYKYSGADRLFGDDWFERTANNAYWLLQIPEKALGKIKSLNPLINIIPFFPPYSLEMGLFKVNNDTKYRTIYIGNDSERRPTFNKYFTNLSKKNRLHLFGGGMSRRREGYEDFNNGTIKMHGPVEQDQVWRTTNLARTSLSVARQRYYDTGWIVHRWLEVVLSGSILLVPREMYGVDQYMNKAFIVDDLEDLEKKIVFFNDKISSPKLIEANEHQKNFVYKYFSVDRGADAIFGAIGR